MKKTIAVLLVLLIGVTLLVGCGGGGSALSGKYTLTSITMDGQTMTVAELKEAASTLGVDFDLSGFYIEFKTGNKFSLGMKMELLGMDEAIEGTYTVNGNKITLTVEGEPQEATINGNKVTISMGEDSMVFEK